MKIGIMQPYFFPYIGYFQLISSVDKYIIYDNLSFIKEGWIMRNRLLQAGGKPFYIFVPVAKKSSYSKISDVKIDKTKDWAKRMIKTIYYAYNKSIYFNDVFPMIEKLLNLEVNNISELNSLVIKEICNYLDINTYIETDMSKYSSIEDELDNLYNEKQTYEDGSIEKKTLRVIKICNKENAETFINAIGGQELYSKQVFKANGIDLKFINTLEYKYKQKAIEFYSNLSIIDVLMNCGKEGTKELLNKYELV